MVDFCSSRLSFGAMIVSIGLWVTPGVFAQETPKQAVAKGQKAVSDKELKGFAKAYVEYHRIRQTYEKRLNNVQDPKEKEKIQREGDSKVSKALEKQGLTPDSYNRLFAAVNNNEQLRKKALKLIEEERKSS